MTQRQLDLALLGGIGVLLLVILILALSSAPTLRASDIGDPAASVAEPAEAEPARAALTEEPAEPPQPSPTETGAETEAEPAAGEAGNETGVFGTDLAAGMAEDAPPAGTTAGTTEVGRVGFAYATGSEGACGVPLTAWAFVAVSRDLLTTYPCGTAVTLTLDDEIAGRREVTAMVGDTMGADITNTVNIFVGEDEPALEYGVTQGSLAP